MQWSLAVMTGVGAAATVWGWVFHGLYIDDDAFPPEWQKGFWTGFMFCGFMELITSGTLLTITLVV